MSLFTQTTGQGPDLVFLHGWGMNGDVWESVIPSLAENYRVTTVDLPGHGRSVDACVDKAGNYSLGEVARQVMEVTPQGSTLVGWSMGGLVATQLVLDNPGVINGLVLVSSAPKFVRDESWPDGMEAEVLDSFAGDLREDYRNTVKRFIAIQAMGSDNPREEQRILRDRVFRHGDPQIAALEGGLRILHNTDLRSRLAEISIPMLLLTGEHDSLFRRQAAEQTRLLNANSKLAVIKGSGHAPFLSHEKEFLKELNAFLLDATISQ
jgi:pimeloyl-[acyl-carrier protein] methyl ester esterase